MYQLKCGQLVCMEYIKYDDLLVKCNEYKNANINQDHVNSMPFTPERKSEFTRLVEDFLSIEYTDQLGVYTTMESRN